MRQLTGKWTYSNFAATIQNVLGPGLVLADYCLNPPETVCRHAVELGCGVSNLVNAMVLSSAWVRKGRRQPSVVMRLPKYGSSSARAKKWSQQKLEWGRNSDVENFLAL